MAKHLFRLCVILFISCLYFSNPVIAGQVVTPELSQWAKEALANEHALSEPAKSKSVAVLYFQNLTGDNTLDPLRKGLSVMLTTDLAKVKDLLVIERVRLQALLEEIELGETGLVDFETTPRVGRLLGVRFLSGGDILKGRVTTLQVDPSLLDASEQVLVNHAAAEGDLNDLIAMEKEILFGIIQQMEIQLSPDEKAELEKPLSTSTAALMLLFKGIDASDHGNYAQAAELYKKALSNDPQLTPAKEALNEINALNLSSQPATEATKPQPAKAGSEGAASAPKAGSGGFLKYTVIGLGVAAAGAGGFYLATADKDDNGGGTSPPTQDRPAVVSTNPANGTTGVSNQLREIRVVFNRSMNTDPNIGQIVTQASDWQVPGAAIKEWQSDRELVIRRIDDNQLAEGGVVISLQGFQDTDNQRMNTYSFSFTISLGTGDVIFQW